MLCCASYELHAKKFSSSVKFFKTPARKSTSNRSSYQKKSPYAGFGKPSKANGRIKTKGVRGYFKPSNGYQFVNPYTRSNQ